MYHYFQNTASISDFAFKAVVINGKLYVLAQHQIPSIMLSGMGFMESGNTEQYSSTGSSHSWQDEYFSRSIEQNKHSDNRMVFKQGNSRHYFVSGVILR
jgi:hypothetical protein